MTTLRAKAPSIWPIKYLGSRGKCTLNWSVPKVTLYPVRGDNNSSCKSSASSGKNTGCP